MNIIKPPKQKPTLMLFKWCGWQFEMDEIIMLTKYYLCEFWKWDQKTLKMWCVLMQLLIKSFYASNRKLLSSFHSREWIGEKKKTQNHFKISLFGESNRWYDMNVLYKIYDLKNFKKRVHQMQKK